MNSTELTSALLSGLLDLEKSGDLVITHPAPQALAERLCLQVLGEWATADLDEPIEAVIDISAESSANKLSTIFNVEIAEALPAIEAFLRRLGESRTPREVAELLAHQGAEEIALGAFFCVLLQRGEYYSSDYLDWRKNHYAKHQP